MTTDDSPIASNARNRGFPDPDLERVDTTSRPSLDTAEIEDVLNDPTLPLVERRARLEGMLGRVGDEEPIERDDAYVPIDMRITDALAMLAEGGHDYAGTALDSEQDSAADRGDDIANPEIR